jgi:predicted O-methyltransferase YrrM
MSVTDSIKAVRDELSAESLKANWCVPPETGHFLAWLATTLQAKTVLEVGTSIGYSGLWWLSALVHQPAGHLHTLDVDPTRQQQAFAHFQAAGVADRVTCHTGEALTVLETLTLPPVDIVFLDARKGDYDRYFAHARRLLRPGGVVVADNTTSHAQAMTAFFDSVKASGCPYTCLDTLGSGLWLVTCL